MLGVDISAPAAPARRRGRARAARSGGSARPVRATSACSRRRVRGSASCRRRRRVGERGVELVEAAGEAFELLAEGCFHGACDEGRDARLRRRQRSRFAARRRRASLTLVVGRQRARSGAGRGAPPSAPAAPRCSPSALRSSASVPCSIFCVRPRESASSTASTSSPLGEQLARARDLGRAPFVGLRVQRLDQRHRAALVEPVDEALHAGLDDRLGLRHRGLALLAGALHQRREVVDGVEVDVGQRARPRARCRAAPPGRP